MLGRLKRLQQLVDSLAVPDIDYDALTEKYVRALDACTLGEQYDSQDLPRRVRPMNLHEKQKRYYLSTARFRTVTAGRRGGKTELACRKFIRKAIRYRGPYGRWIVAAPTHPQVIGIYWERVLSMLPQWAIVSINITHSWIRLFNGTVICFFGMDKPARVEGPPMLGALLDEYANMKSQCWPLHVRPALTDTQGEADFVGVPEGANHYKKLVQGARDSEGWDTFSWWTEEVLPMYLGKHAAELEIAAAMRDLDEMSFKQEYRGEFVSFAGRAYYGFNAENIKPWTYDPKLRLDIMMDFNVSPGTANMGQSKGGNDYVFDEIYVPRFSRTEIICRAIKERYKHDQDKMWFFGDATGGAYDTTSEKNDWDIVMEFFPDAHFDIPSSNPGERERVNLVNARICSMNKERRFFVDPRCSKTIADFEGVSVLEGTSGDLDKRSDPTLTHLSDGVGYWLHRKHASAGIYTRQM